MRSEDSSYLQKSLGVKREGESAVPRGSPGLQINTSNTRGTHT